MKKLQLLLICALSINISGHASCLSFVFMMANKRQRRVAPVPQSQRPSRSRAVTTVSRDDVIVQGYPVELARVARPPLVTRRCLQKIVENELGEMSRLAQMKREDTRLRCRESESHGPECACSGTGSVTITQLLNASVFDGLRQNDRGRYNLSEATGRAVLFLRNIYRRYNVSDPLARSENDKIARRIKRLWPLQPECGCGVLYHRRCYEEAVAPVERACGDVACTSCKQMIGRDIKNKIVPPREGNRCSICNGRFVH